MEDVRILKRSLAALALTTAALGLASAAYQTWGSARDRRKFPPPGRMIDVGGRCIHLWTEGEGGPAVVLVPALGTSSLDFARILPALAKQTTTVILDRPGLGWSDPVQGPAALLGAADDLHAALQAAGVTPPYVLVGHSIGGYIVRLYAAAHPDEVAGAVLIDPSHHDQFRRFPHYRAKIYQYALRWRLRPYGVDRLAHDLGLRYLKAEQANRYPAEHVDAAVAASLADRKRRADMWELLTWPRLAAETGRLAPSLGSTPLTVVSSSELSSAFRTPKQIAKRRADYKIWYPMQVELAALSTNSRHIVAENASHYVHHYRPELVVDAILDMVKRSDT